jgi:hypothetical protein
MISKGLRDALLTAWISLIVAAAIVGSYVVAYFIETPLDPMSTALVYTTSGLSVMVAGGFLISLVMLIYLGVKEHGAGIWNTAFYRPQILKHACLLAITAPTGLRGIDRILHHGLLHWSVFLDPEILILAVAYYFGVLFFSLWYTGAWVATSGADRRETWRRVIVACVVAELLLVAILVVLYRIGP